ncbi:DnaD domain-containing protein [Alkalibacterium olivapovliticus]|uniref:DNA replication protein n=1 Tax=Alkalibacterium olivapovliticus TaxID=99907 RepID=A0A2T0W9D9_9LACT|nr:DnaD domain-containing protein [Alkalibacterium olivapovliticus]PRY83246.1 DNA replication protein [Alkalibacterium olivapovliticus]
MSDLTIRKWIKAGNTTIPNTLLMYYRELGLNSNDLVVLIQLMSLVEIGQRFPDSQLLADRLDVSREEAYKAIHQLMTKRVITIETSSDEEGKSQDEFSFDLLYERLIYLMDEVEKTKESKKEAVTSKDLYRLFEEEFGRGLSAMEIQTLEMWIKEDLYSSELIEAALREAVLSQVYSLKYIDRILLTWEKKNIKTKEQVEKESKRHRQNQSRNSSNEDANENEKPVPMYNWLKDSTDK